MESGAERPAKEFLEKEKREERRKPQSSQSDAQ
jgi:hypothetical protein